MKLRSINLAAFLLPLALLSACNKDRIEFERPLYDVYPNPCVDVFSVSLHQLPAGESATFRLYDGQDNAPRELGTFNGGANFSVSVMDLEPGVFHLEMQYKGERYSQPVLKAQ